MTGYPGGSTAPVTQASYQPAPYSGPPVAAAYTIQVWNAVVSPGKGGGNKPWDGTNAIPPDAMKSVISALGAVNKYAALVAAFGQLANGAYDPPDVRADVKLLISGAAVQVKQLPTTPDSFVPSWPRAASFSHVPLDDRLAIEVHLVDTDMAFDDEMGTVIIPMSEIRAAVANSGSIHQVRVDGQNPQILLIGLAAFRE